MSGVKRKNSDGASAGAKTMFAYFSPLAKIKEANGNAAANTGDKAETPTKKLKLDSPEAKKTGVCCDGLWSVTAYTPMLFVC